MTAKIHYFVVAGYIDATGNVRLGDDPGVAAAVLDGTIYDETTNDWSTPHTDTEVSDDERILAVLRQRLTGEVSA